MHPTEAAFQKALNKRPRDKAARLALADWLDEQGDERAAGYRALAAIGVRPYVAHSACWYWFNGSHYPTGQYSHSPCNLPGDWHELTTGRPHRTRAGAEDAAARAFLKLSAERQAELLSGVLANAS
jgi:uncharacterized protein (TIGR02996 family)